MSNNVLIVGLTGMPGAGKSTLAKLLIKKGMPVVIMGDAVREAAKRANLEMTDANLGNLMIRLRKEKGSGAIAYLVLDRIRSIIVSSPNMNAIIVDGIRNIEEMKVLGSLGAVKLLAIHGSSLVRFKHVKARARSDAPDKEDDFSERDRRELTVGISEAIALADESVSNNTLTIDQLGQQGLAIIEKWLLENRRD
ncbi:MAG TPA: AAA family ATPase [Nitrososphaeraceae archaeon]|nr:AAA family ATPase [Nitrososphaeraceae archaeon]